MMKEALFWEKTLRDNVRCNLCIRKCDIKEGCLGYCGTRLNQNGTLYTLTYGRVAVMSICAIENKPMYHFFPGSLWLSVGGLGCNFRCGGCNNSDLSHADVKRSLFKTTYMTPEMVVKKAKENNCMGIAFTYNEPTMWFEFVLDVFKLAKQAGLSTCYVTNAGMSPAALGVIGEVIDGFCADVKGAFVESYSRIADVSDVNIIFSNVSEAKRKFAMHVEVVTNIIEGYNSNEAESREIASWIFAELGKDTPWHLTKFFPSGKFKDVGATSIGILRNLYSMGKKEGIYYVYIGGIQDNPEKHTYCHNCKRMLIKRKQYGEIENYLVDGHCPYCKTLIVGRYPYQGV
ncbi:MAG: AmmeMemoRadiSam system radical SAM enzyme [Candidatus Omnitrophota bacterium]|nr:MAG: AmmeMemoRadiSam system radical SAM enzyme [Candidatus Omnitrophota bacterium]